MIICGGRCSGVVWIRRGVGWLCDETVRRAWRWDGQVWVEGRRGEGTS